MNTLQVVHSVAREVIRNLDFWFAPEAYQGEELVSAVFSCMHLTLRPLQK